MAVPYPKSPQDCNFDSSREQFERIVGLLQAQESLRMSADAVEQLLVDEGRELQRRLLQEHLLLRGAAEARLRLVQDADGASHDEVRALDRQLCSMFGGVTVWRLAYQSPGTRCLCPLESTLNLPRGLHSFGLRRLVAMHAAKESFDEVIHDVQDRTGVRIHKRQAEEVAQASAVDFERFYVRGPIDPNSVSPTAAIVLNFDGKGIIMREEDLRELTRRKAAKARRKLKKRRAKGEKPNRKRMAEVAVVYAVEPFVRDAEDVMREFRPVKEVRKRRPKPTHKRVWASVEREAEDVIDEAFEHAKKLDPNLERPWVVVVDGNNDQIELIRAAIRRHRVPVTILCDVIHVLEYLWKAAYCFYSDGSEEAEVWVTERLRALLTGKDPSQVAAGMRRSATNRQLSDKQRKPVDDCARYLIRKRKMLDYADALRQGFPISTGVVEGACRHLVSRRMDVSGAPWSLRGAEAVVKLRALWMSGDFEEYWRFHLDQENERNHRRRYLHGVVPDPLPVLAEPRRKLRRVK